MEHFWFGNFKGDHRSHCQGSYELVALVDELLLGHLCTGSAALRWRNGAARGARVLAYRAGHREWSGSLFAKGSVSIHTRVDSWCKASVCKLSKASRRSAVRAELYTTQSIANSFALASGM